MLRKMAPLAIGWLVFLSPPSGAQEHPLPRYLTDAEREFLAERPLVAQRGGGAPTGPLWCPPEYAPTERLLMAWEGSDSWNLVLARMAAQVTTVGDADVTMVVEGNSRRDEAQAALQSAGADMSRVAFMIKRLDTIWIRDYGPRFVYEGGVRVIVDHTYNRPRPYDDGFPDFFGAQAGFAGYDIPLIHGGGNFHLSGLADSHASTLIEAENPGLTRQDIVALWQEYQGLDTSIHQAFRPFIDATQHIDMWMIPVADRRVIISDWPLAPGSYEDNICDTTAALLAGEGYEVFRTPAVSSGGTHYTFANSVLCNGLACIPSYTNGTAAQYNDDALAVWQQACPDKTVVQIPSQAIVTAAGVLHCVVMHVPENSLGEIPTIYLRSLNEPATLEPGQQVPLEWIADDDIDTYYVKLQLSLDGGQTWPITVAPWEDDDGSFMWTVPDVSTAHGRIRAVIYDWDEGISDDINDADFVIEGDGGCVADFNGDGVVNTQDVLAFLNAWTSGDGSADINGDGQVNTLDVLSYLNHWSNGC